MSSSFCSFSSFLSFRLICFCVMLHLKLWNANVGAQNKPISAHCGKLFKLFIWKGRCSLQKALGWWKKSSVPEWLSSGKWQFFIIHHYQDVAGHTVCILRSDKYQSCSLLQPGCRSNPLCGSRGRKSGAKQRHVVAAAALWLIDLPVTPPPRKRGMSVGGAGTESRLPWQHLQCTGTIVYLPLRGLANGGILIGPSLMFPTGGRIDSYPSLKRGEGESRLVGCAERQRVRRVMPSPSCA